MVISKSVIENEHGLMTSGFLRDFIFDTMGGKSLYKVCVKVINKDKLKRMDTPWRDHLSADIDVKPFWGSCYKPPLAKNVGDLQWRILHGIVAVNAFISVLNPNVQDCCPFCDQRETIFHCFMHCERLRSLFALLEIIFTEVNEMFTMVVFIFGFKYCKRKKRKGRLLNFILGQAKMAVYISRKYRIAHGTNKNVECLFKGLIKDRVKHDFIFYSHMKKLEEFEVVWSVEKVVCCIENDALKFFGVFE